ncbi:sensor histidine kinase [Pseudomonas sp. BCA14]|uniref:hybrid sensor histidine kinase/response regulator n=1 Tax=unclassified Pseudomonas TaxID=196821 RepID=UPI00106E98C3|nr:MULTISPECIES: hybrid sensor histidine kinase/response regulator [unclassified Pseudomonas]TFF13569.1 sensor histidine kinase [Pseudomonas sp. JMN1]TFF15747.1 sensor histidine kinase [Pseudomonas sp. BCA17]TFF30525.1 sensor histidine kinase [Pseudomonas sp. BCA14]TFF33107.1 sensor histidine kinase [Pseudomonas sp. BCA13]
MKHNNAILEAFTRSSVRLNKGLMVLIGIALLLLLSNYWSLQRGIETRYGATRFHFARLMENFAEQQTYLKSLTHPGIQAELLRATHVQVSLKSRMVDNRRTLYEGQKYSFSVPFSVKFDEQQVGVAARPPIFALGAHLTSYYSAFWSSSPYEAPQTFLLNRQTNYTITIPSVGYQRRETTEETGNLVALVKAVQNTLAQTPQPLEEDRVYWQTGPEPGHLLAYIGLPLDGQGQAVVGTLLDLAQVDDVQRALDHSAFDRFTLIAPDGNRLIGPATLAPLSDGVHFTAQGFEFKITQAGDQPWSAVYGLDYSHFFHSAVWPLSTLTLLLASLITLGWAGSRWYRRQVITPARLAHEHIAESVAFSRVVIDTAPTGLCVVRRSDGKVLIENQRAQQWPGSARLVAAMAGQHEHAENGETHLEIEGRHLQIGFVSTRYQAENVRLYAFNDITRHVEDAQALEEARHAADTANKAKTLFLATMSHEIRTPLYGVLGTLELLGLTDLNPHQQTYLHTIQRSSATLFQLISDVLDVSKIESGQMVIEAMDFCPLDILEDTLHTYAASAQRKGLQLYSCIDPQLPDGVIGDPIRIRQILNNLVSNAIKFTDSGRVVIRARVTGRDADNVDLEWQVADSGVGIPEAQQAKLFDLFYQAPDTACEGGAGLGLPICRWLAQMMQGEIRVVSEPGLGSSFTLKMRLPLCGGTLPNLPLIEPSSTPVYVQAPVLELAQATSDWLNRLGIAAVLAATAQEKHHRHAVLVDLLPNEPLHPWPGQRVLCLPGAHSPPLYTAQGWVVDMHDVRTLAATVSLAQHGKHEQLAAAQPQSAGQLGLRILVAEDNPVNQAIIKEQLEALGCSVTLAANGEQALQLWQPQVFDLVLTDVNMPLMNGYELARALREHDPHLPILGVTANAMREEGMRCLAVGMNAWIVKPLSLQTLRAQLIKWCRVKPPPEPVAEVFDDGVQLSDKMRALFISTVQQDLRRIGAALEQRDAHSLGHHLHSVAGALGAVQAVALSQACIELESALNSSSLNTALVLKVKAVMQRMSAILETLQPGHTSLT